MVFQIITSTLSGQGRLTHDLLRVFPEDEYECHVAYTRGPLMDDKHDFRFGNQWEVYFHGVMTRLTDRQGFYSKAATRQLTDYMDRLGVDLVHLHQLHGYYLHLPTLFGWLKEREVPVIWMQHDCWNFTGHCVHFSSIKCEKWRDGCHHCPIHHEYPASVADASAKNYADKYLLFTSLSRVMIITPSKWLKDLVEESFLGVYPVTCIHNGINLKIFRPKQPQEISFSLSRSFSGVGPNYRTTNLPNDKTTEQANEQIKVVLGLAANFNPSKGYDDFIRLRTMLPDDYVIVMVGVSAKQKRELPDGIIGIEHTRNVEQLVDIYNQAHLFLNLTYNDNFPTTNLEAMACGTSVLTYRTGGSPHAITETTGYVVEQGDLERVRDIVLAHQKTEATINACVARSRLFDRDTIYTQYQALYRKMLLEVKSDE